MIVDAIGGVFVCHEKEYSSDYMCDRIKDVVQPGDCATFINGMLVGGNEDRSDVLYVEANGVGTNETSLGGSS